MLADNLRDKIAGYHGDLLEYKGVVNQGGDGDFGNEGRISLVQAPWIEVPGDPNTGLPKDGFYIVRLSLSKVSVEFDFTPNDGEPFDPDKFVEISVPVKLPDCIKHGLYGRPEFNLVTDYLYNGESIQEYDGKLVDRGYDDHAIIFSIKDGKPRILYQNYDGEEIWLTPPLSGD